MFRLVTHASITYCDVSVHSVQANDVNLIFHVIANVHNYPLLAVSIQTCELVLMFNPFVIVHLSDGQAGQTR